jgi:hypothetical protein
MAKVNAPYLAFNRGLITPKALARVDLDRTKLSAEVFTNWLPKSQGAMTIRPGTKYLGSSYNDSGAQFLEFVASTDSTALVELTHQMMRVWVSSDTGNEWETPVAAGLDVPLSRPPVDTTVSLTDTGWSNTSIGGSISTVPVDLLPVMTAETTNGIQITASSQDVSGLPDGDASAWRVGDDNIDSFWQDTGNGELSTLPSWLNVDFGTDTGGNKAVKSYSLRCDDTIVSTAPMSWRLIAGEHDTGTYATDTGKWSLEDERSAQTAWAASEKRSFERLDADTGTVLPHRHWRLYFTETVEGNVLRVTELELFDAVTAQQVKFVSGQSIMNATSIGALARMEKRVLISDTGTEHSLDITIDRGPVVIRVGSSQRDDDYVRETSLGTGRHNLAFTPEVDFWITMQSDAIVNRIVGGVSIGDSGTVELTTDIDANELSSVRFDQSADVVYLNGDGFSPLKIERRGTGRSWSIVDYAPDNGPFQPFGSSSAKLSPSAKYGNISLRSDTPFFTSGHQNALFRLFHSGQSGEWPLGAINAATDAIMVTGISDTGDTGTPSQGSERRITVNVTGTYVGTIQLERSFEGTESGFHPVSTSGGYITSGLTSSDTGTFDRVINDPDDNSDVWYRARMNEYTSGVAMVKLTHEHGGVFGVARALSYATNTEMTAEVLSRFSDTGSSDVWEEGAWSDRHGYPTSVALHGGRLFHAGDANLYGSVSDDYENFDDGTEGDAAPLSKTLGSGPVDNIYYLIALLRLVVGTSGSELAVRSSSLDEPLTPTNASVRAFSTQGSANLRPVKMDQDAIFIQRSGQRAFKISFGQDAFGDYQASELTLLVPDLLVAGVVSIAIQRQPDTRVHFVLANGKVAILTYEPQEEVLCWSMWETDGLVERAMVLPGQNEDRVYYHINRTINGVTRRFLETWALETECVGDTGLTFLADCSVSLSDTGRTVFVSGLSHLAGESVIVCGDDTGQTYPFKDYSYDTGGAQRTYTVDTGSGIATLSATVHHAVAGLPYSATWKSTKLAHAAQGGTPLAQMKTVDKIGFILYRAHNAGLYFGNDTGKLDPMPRKRDGARVDSREVFDTFDETAMPFPGLWDSDSRIVLVAKAPRPMTVLAAVPSIQTIDNV